MKTGTNSVKYIFATMIAFFFFISAPVFLYADEDDDSIIPDSIDITKGVDIVSTGAATYSIPIEVPPGRKGVEPKLSLTYNSYSSNGWVGVGWSLDIGSIQRSTKHGVSYTASDFVVKLNGSSSELVSRADINDWGPGYYGSKIEGAFTKYYYDSSKNGWLATTKDGMKYFFGMTDSAGDPYSRQSNTNGTFMWCLKKVIDTNGNYMTITYDNYCYPTYTTGEIYPSRIDYTGPSATKYVIFARQSRTDTTVSYKTKAAVQTTQRLSTISTYGASGQLARQYVLTYNNNTINGRSRLSQVQVKGSGLEATIKPIKFTYYAGGNNTVGQPQYLELGTFYADNMLLAYGEINGDGKMDFIRYYSMGAPADQSDSYWYVVPFLSNGDGTFEKQPLKLLNKFTSSTYARVRLADVNSDGLAEIICDGVNDNGINGVYTYFLNSDGTFKHGTFTAFSAASRQIQVLDVNGDGMGDLINIDSSNNVCLYLSNGDGSFQSAKTSSSSYTFAGLADVNGDGYLDLIRYPGNGGSYIYLYNKTDEKFNISYSGELAPGGGYFLDINGDGLADIVDKDCDSSGKLTITTHLSKGDGNFVQAWSYDFNSQYSKVNSLGDINGDGLPDFDAYLYTWGSGHALLINKGDGTFIVEEYNVSHFVSHRKDINGDGMVDDIWPGTYSSGYCWVTTLAQTADPGGPADYLKTITNEYGGVTTITYGNSSDSDYADNDIPFIVHPVTQIVTHDGINADSLTAFNDYSGGYYDRESHEFYGFEYVKKTNPDNSVTETTYLMDEYRKGRPDQILVRKPNGTLIKKTSLTWNYYALTSLANFVYLDLKRTETYDTQTAFTQEDYIYDADDIINGNLTSVVTSGTGAETVTKDYTYINKGTWVWRLESETITGSASGEVRNTEYAYYSTTGNLDTTTYNNDSGTSPVVTYGYDSYGNVTSVTDARGNATTTVYDATNTYPITITYPATSGVSHIESKTWDNRFGKELTKTDQNSQTTTLQYDGYGRIEQVDYPDDGQTLYTYNDDYTSYKVNVEKNVREGTGTSSLYVPSYTYYDGFGRVIQNTSQGESSYITTRSYYDNMGRNDLTIGPFFTDDYDFFTLLRSAYANYTYTLTSYDYLGRPLTVTSPGEDGDIVTSYSYTGLSTTITDPDDKVKTEKKDCLGRVIQVQEDSGGGTTYYSYNAAGDLLEVEDDDGNLTSMTYDTLGRKVDMTDPDMGYWEYTYDNNGNMLTQTDAKGQTITFTYDKLNRMTFKNYSTSYPDVTYAYDSATNGIGLLYSVSDINSNVTTVNDSYDAMGRVTSVTKTITGDSARNTLYEYDYSGKVVNTTYPGTYVVTNSYYAGSNLLYQVKKGSTAFATISNYEPTGKMGTLTHANGTSTTYTYDEQSTRLTGILTKYGTSTVLQNRAYTYSNAGDINTIVDTKNSVTYSYGYDDLHRLETETSGGVYGALTVNYNAIGNITSKTVGSTTLTYAYNTAHKHAVSSINGYSFTYDANGNMLTGYDFTTPSSPVARTTTWNADNMPATITYGSTTTTLLYDGTGARAKKTVGSTITYYIGDHYEIKGGVIYKYIFAGNLRVAQIAGSTVSYFHKDHLGSSTIMTNSSGTQIESTNYEPFGGTRAHTGTTTSGYKFTDQELDAENGLYNYDARLYDPVMGRFISSDTVIPEPYNPQSLNRYSYCLNNPLIYIDPNGHVATDDEFTLEEIEQEAAAQQAAQQQSEQAKQNGSSFASWSVISELWNSWFINDIMGSSFASSAAGFNDPYKNQMSTIQLDNILNKSNYKRNDFRNREEAARAAIMECLDLQNKTHVEWGTSIYKDANGYYYNKPNYGNTDKPWYNNVRVPFTNDAVAIVHVHPTNAIDYMGYFSGDDLAAQKDPSVAFYVGTVSGFISRSDINRITNYDIKDPY